MPISGRDGELVERLLDTADDPAPQVRAVVTTLLIKGLVDDDASALIALMVRSDGAARIVDPEVAETAYLQLRGRLAVALSELVGAHNEPQVVRAWRDYLLSQMERWASRAVDDADNRKRAERFLLFADNPAALAALPKRRGFLLGMSAHDLRVLAETRGTEPVSPETATGLWAEHEAWRRRVVDLLGEETFGRLGTIPALVPGRVSIAARGHDLRLLA